LAAGRRLAFVASLLVAAVSASEPSELTLLGWTWAGIVGIESEEKEDGDPLAGVARALLEAAAAEPRPLVLLLLLLLLSPARHEELLAASASIAAQRAA
jgi:hypothetical protein